MIEGILGIALLIWFMCNNDPAYLIAAALFIIASNISYLDRKEK